MLKRLGETKTKFNRCVVIYWDNGTGLISTETGVPIDVGWEVEAVPPGDSPVVSAKIPAGRVATTIHIGPYNLLKEAHAAIQAWCRENQIRMAGPSWEVYDHPREGQPVRTDVFYLLA